MLSLSSASADGGSLREGRTSDEVVEHYQIEAEYYRSKAAALMQKYEPPANDEIAVYRVVLDVLQIRLEEETAHLRRLQKADELDRQAVGASELFVAHIQREINKMEQRVSHQEAFEV
ncbi:hypothetical protein [Cerasicoccus arenae]|nr:hypothetical protein [Cerasicoccus arenae]